jgi:hypothetical protein
MVYQQKISHTQLQYDIKYTIGGGYMFRPLRGHPLINNLIKSITHEMLANYGIPCVFTRMLMNKIK